MRRRSPGTIKISQIKVGSGDHFEISKNHNIFTMDGQIFTKFGMMTSLDPPDLLRKQNLTWWPIAT